MAAVNENNYWYILHVKTGREQAVKYEIERRWKMEDVAPFIPVAETMFRRGGVVKKERKRMFPGYVFLESGLGPAELRANVRGRVAYSNSIFRLMRYGDSDEYAMREEEKAPLLALCNGERCVEASIGFIEGDHVEIKSGPLMGREGSIKKINRHKYEAILEMDMMGQAITVAVGLELLNKP